MAKNVNTESRELGPNVDPSKRWGRGKVLGFQCLYSDNEQSSSSTVEDNRRDAGQPLQLHIYLRRKYSPLRYLSASLKYVFSHG